MNSNALQLHYYYTGNGGFDGICPSDKCPVCNAGEYRSGCGNDGIGTVSDAQKVNTGGCVACSNKPAYSTYSAYPSEGTFTNTCPFTCNAGYLLSGSNCVATSCSAPVDVTKELVPDTPSPACNTRCKAGYRGDAATNPTTCTICSAGTIAAAGSTTCSPCAAGTSTTSLQGQTACTPCDAGSSSAQGAATCTPCAAGSKSGSTGSTSCTTCDPGSFSSGTGNSICTACSPGYFSSSSGVTQCSPCLAGTYGASSGLTMCSTCTTSAQGVPSYTPSNGLSACTPCVTCVDTGKYRAGCGGSSAGSCAVCSN